MANAGLWLQRLFHRHGKRIFRKAKLSSHRVKDKGTVTKKRNHELRGNAWTEKNKLQAPLQMRGLARPSRRRGRHQAHHHGRTTRQGNLVPEPKVGHERGLRESSWSRGA